LQCYEIQILQQRFRTDRDSGDKDHVIVAQ
jgi:hypothetical protein